MPDILFGDFEARSAVDIKKCGADVYARDRTTRATAFGYAFNDDEVLVSRMGEPPEPAICDHIESGGKFVAHNAPFELLIWNHVYRKEFPFLPELKPEQMVCTMALAYAMALPGSLENAAAASGLDMQKDMQGHRVMLQIAQPRDIKEDGSIVWWTPEENPEKFERMYKYCATDIVVERALYKRLVKLSEYEKKVWILDNKINQRGVKVDVSSVKAAIEVVGHAKGALDERMREATNNAVATCSAVAQLTDWLRDHGVLCEGVAKAQVVDMLDTEGLPDNCANALKIRQLAAKSSTAKLTAMLRGICDDSRMRGLFQYSGAGTRRWAGRRVQLQNLPRQINFDRDDLAHVFEILNSAPTPKEASEQIELTYGNPMLVVSEAVRGCLIAEENNDLASCDFANIEGRVLAWLAGEAWKIKAFEDFDNGIGPDLYKVSASRIYHIPIESVDDWQRLIGKVAELACGYQGGVKAFHSMAKNYLVKVPDKQADQIKTGWREAHPRVVKYWYDIEEAAMSAVLKPGTTFYVGLGAAQIKYRVAGSFLWCCLPSGGVLCYPYPKIQQVETPWGQMKDALTYMGEDANTGKWCRQTAYGGLLAENVTQAVARDLLVEGMFGLEAHGYPIIMHVHDEIICELKEGFGSVEEMSEIMVKLPVWAKGLPVTAEGWRDKRYRKG